MGLLLRSQDPPHVLRSTALAALKEQFSMQPNLTTHYLGLSLKSPIVASPSPLTGDLDALARLAEAGIAAAVLPSLFEEQFSRPPSGPRQQYEYTSGCYAATLSSTSDVHRHSVGPHDYLQLIEAAKQAVPIPIIGSLNGCSRGGWVRFAREIEDAGADALELNVYNVPTSPEVTAKDIEDEHLELVEAVRDAISIPLAVKIGAQFTCLPNFVGRLAKAGADGVVLFNRYLEPDIDLKTLQVTPQLTLSTNHEMRLPLRWVSILRDQVSLSLAASGGVQSANDVAKLLLAGADVVMMTSTLLKRGSDCVAGVIADLQRWLEANDFAAVADAQGSLSSGHRVDSGEIERSYYMRAIASYSALHQQAND
jgi:dihydroorotate dehydrogenase (fumarate)